MRGVPPVDATANGSRTISDRQLSYLFLRVFMTCSVAAERCLARLRRISAVFLQLSLQYAALLLRVENKAEHAPQRTNRVLVPIWRKYTVAIAPSSDGTAHRG